MAFSRIPTKTAIAIAAVATLTACGVEPPAPRPSFYAVDMIRDANGNDRGAAAHEIADATCNQRLNDGANDLVLRGLAMGILPPSNAHETYFDSRFPTCMRSLGFKVFTSEAAAHTAAAEYRADAKKSTTAWPAD